MNITIVSAFSGAESYLKRYFDQMNGLQRSLARQKHTLTLVLGEGDSTDKTLSLLQAEAKKNKNITLVDVTHHGVVFDSVVHQQRFKQLAFIGNKLWAEIPEDSDVVGLVEADLIWEPASLSKLIKGVQNDIAVAPLVIYRKDQFYDVWAFRKAGALFTAEPPYHPALVNNPSRYVALDSAGSMLFVRGETARQISWPEHDVVVGLCRQMRLLGTRIFLDTQVKVRHPDE